jgi:hypothetical protein
MLLLEITLVLTAGFGVWLLTTFVPVVVTQ